MSPVEDEPRSIQRREVDSRGVTLREIQGSHQRTSDPVLGEGFQRHEIVVAVDGGHNDPVLAACRQFGIHHDSGKAAVAIGEWMDLSDEKHHEDGTLQWSGQAPVDFEALREGTRN